jgi:DNA-binding transcriptional MerR regulator
MTDGLWKIGDLARRTGVSVRTLHHYDEIGLLSPSHRSEGGHRLYGRDEVIRLQQILSLRQSGFALEQIRELLGREDFDVRAVIDVHLARLRSQIAAQQELCARLEAIAAHYSSATAEEFIQAIEVMTMFEKYYTKEQLDTLARRREQLGEERMRQAPEEWATLMRDVREHMKAGTDPKDERVQALARKWRSLIDEFTGGDPAIEESLKNMYRGETKFAGEQGVDRELGEYLGRALA